MSIRAVLVAIHQSHLRDQSLADTLVRLLHTLRRSFFKAVIGEEQCTRIELLAAASLRIRLELRIPSARFYFFANAASLSFAFFNCDPIELAACLHFKNSIECDPAH